MASVASQLIEEVTAHAQSDSLEDAREICAEGTYFPNNLPTSILHVVTGSEKVDYVFNMSETLHICQLYIVKK